MAKPEFEVVDYDPWADEIETTSLSDEFEEVDEDPFAETTEFEEVAYDPWAKKPVETMGEVDLPPDEDYEFDPHSEEKFDVDMWQEDPDFFSQHTLNRIGQALDKSIGDTAKGVGGMVDYAMDLSMKGPEGERKKEEFREDSWTGKLRDWGNQFKGATGTSSGDWENAIVGMASFGLPMAITTMAGIPLMVAGAGVAAVAGTGLGTGLTLAALFGDKNEQYLAEGVDAKTANEAAAIYAGMNAPLEMAGNLLGIKALTKGIGTLARGLKIGPRVGKMLGAISMGTFGEGMEEGFQAYPEALADIYAHNPDKSIEEIKKMFWEHVKTPEFKEMRNESIKLGMMGGLLFPLGGAAIGVPGNVSSYATEKRNEIYERMGLNEEQKRKLDQEEDVSGFMPSDKGKDLDAAFETDEDAKDDAGIETVKSSESLASGVTPDQETSQSEVVEVAARDVRNRQENQKKMDLAMKEGELQEEEAQKQAANLESQRIEQEKEKAAAVIRQRTMDAVSTEDGTMKLTSRILHKMENSESKTPQSYKPIKSAHEALAIEEDSVKSLKKARYNLREINQNTANENEQILTYGLDKLLTARIDKVEYDERVEKQNAEDKKLSRKSEKLSTDIKSVVTKVKKEETAKAAETKKLAEEYDERYRQKEKTPYEKIPKTVQAKSPKTETAALAKRKIEEETAAEKKRVESQTEAAKARLAPKKKERLAEQKKKIESRRQKRIGELAVEEETKMEESYPDAIKLSKSGKVKLAKKSKPIVLRSPGKGGRAAQGVMNAKKITKKNHVYRGMTQAEYDNTVAGGFVESRKDYSFGKEGTSFGADFETAESYINYGKDDPRKTGKPTYIVEVKQAGNLKRNRQGYYEAHKAITDKQIKRVWKVEAVGDELIATEISKTTPAKTGKAKLNDIKLAVQPLKKHMGSRGLTTIVVENPGKLPDTVKKKLSKQDTKLTNEKGINTDTHVYLFSDNLVDSNEAIATWMHEHVGHSGLKKFAKSVGMDFSQLMTAVYNEVKNTSEFKLLDKLYAPETKGMTPSQKREYLAEEFMAKRAETLDPKKRRKLWQRIRNFINDWLGLVFNTTLPVVNMKQIDLILEAAKSHYMYGEIRQKLEFVKPTQHYVDTVKYMIKNHPKALTWEANSKKLIDDNFGADAGLFNILLAMTSPGARIKTNAKWAVQTYLYLQGKLPLAKSRFPNSLMAKLEKMTEKFPEYRLDEEGKLHKLKDPKRKHAQGKLYPESVKSDQFKVAEFIRAMLGDELSTVNDRWMYRIFFGPSRLTMAHLHNVAEGKANMDDIDALFSKPEQFSARHEIFRVVEQLNKEGYEVTPAQVQAALWVRELQLADDKDTLSDYDEGLQAPSSDLDGLTPIEYLNKMMGTDKTGTLVETLRLGKIPQRSQLDIEYTDWLKDNNVKPVNVQVPALNPEYFADSNPQSLTLDGQEIELAEFKGSKKFKSLLKTRNFSILTAENPQGNELSEKENIKRNKKLVKKIQKAGYQYTPVEGRYGNIEDSFLIFDITTAEALELVKEFNQESVISNGDLVYQDGSYQKGNLDKTIYSNKLKNFYTSVYIKGKEHKFSIPLSDDRVIRVAHFSNKEGLEEIDPEFMGTGEIGAERKQMDRETGKMMPGYLKKSAWYVPKDNKSMEEHRFEHKPVYETTVKLDDLYEMTSDQTETTSDVELQKLGYKGYYVPSVGQIRLFDKVGATYLGKGKKFLKLDPQVTQKEDVVSKTEPVTYTKEYTVEETGEKVTLKIDAEEALAGIEEDLFSLKVLKDCIG